MTSQDPGGYFGVLVPPPRTPGSPGDIGASTAEQQATVTRLSTSLLETMFNTRELDAPLLKRHISPRVVGVGLNGIWTSTSRPALMRMVRHQTSTVPSFRLRVQEDLVGVDMVDPGRAVAWVTAKAEGSPVYYEATIVREWVMRIEWRRRCTDGKASGRWRTEKIEALSMAGGFIGVL